MVTRLRRNAQAYLEERMEEHLVVARSFCHSQAANLVAVGECLANTLLAKKKVLIAGNGGSAADAQHFAAELVGRYLEDRRPLAAIALTTDTSALTAIGNDYSFDDVFSRQVEALGAPGDMFFAISTSGRSRNVVNAALKALELGLTVVVLTGNNHLCALAELASYSIHVPSTSTPRVQEMHIFAIHEIVDVCEKYFLNP